MLDDACKQHVKAVGSHLAHVVYEDTGHQSAQTSWYFPLHNPSATRTTHVQRGPPAQAQSWNP